jgi:hypothetical protein
MSDSPNRAQLAYPLYPPITDGATVLRLFHAYGDRRASEIIAGRDMDTARDIARWRTLGVRK